MYYDDDMSVLGDMLGYGDYDELGARVRDHRKPRTRGAMTFANKVRDRRLASVAAQVREAAPGVPGLEAAMLPLGFTTIQFVNAGATTLTSTSTPQKPFKGQRLVVSLARTAAATQLVVISRFLIGATNVLPSGQPIDVGAFAGGAFHTVLDLVPAGPGITISIDYTVSAAPGVGETIDVATTLIGPSLTS